MRGSSKYIRLGARFAEQVFLYSLIKSAVLTAPLGHIELSDHSTRIKHSLAHQSVGRLKVDEPMDT